MKRRNYLILIFTFLISLLLISNSDKDDNSNSGLITDLVSGFDIVKSNDWDKITINEIVLENNTWNKAKYSGEYEQAIFKASNKSDTPFGWAWNWPNMTFDVVAYPELIYGHKPWNSISTTTNLPAQINEKKQITVNYDIKSDIEETKAYNLAFDIWINSESDPTEQNIKMELMIWLDKKGMSPAGNYQGKVTVEGEEYHLSIGNVTHAPWQYVAFEKTSPEYSGDTKVDKFIDYLLKNHSDIIKESWYIASIELGNEVIFGKGITTINSFSVDFK